MRIYLTVLLINISVRNIVHSNTFNISSICIIYTINLNEEKKKLFYYHSSVDVTEVSLPACLIPICTQNESSNNT